MLERIEIIATIGPASNSYEAILDLIKTGTTVFRISFSFGSHEDHAITIKTIKRVKEECGSDIMTIADLQGRVFQIGRIENNALEIEKGQIITFVNEPCLGNLEKIYFNYENFSIDTKVGDKILIDYGQLIFRVIETNKLNTVLLKAETAGVLSSNKGVYLPETNLSVSSLTQKDFDDLKFIIDQQLNWISCPFMQSIDDLKHLHSLLNSSNYQGKVLIKIKRIESVKIIDSILEYCEGVIWSRADLCVEYNADDVFYAEREIINTCKKRRKIFFLATQIMDSMIVNSKPTIAEIYGLAYAVTDGVSGVILSGETSVGNHPTTVVRALKGIIDNISTKPRNRYLSRFITVNPEFRTLLIQYLNFFNEYASVTKKNKVKLNLAEYEEGIELQFLLENPENNNLALNYFKEYLEFIAEKQGELRINFEKSVSEQEKELLILSLRNEIQQLKFKLELKEMKMSLLSQNIYSFFEDLKDESNHILSINLSTGSSSIKAEKNIGVNSKKKLCDDLRKVRRKISNNELQNALKLFNQICENQLPGYINESISFSRRHNEVSKLYNLGMIKLDDRLLMENQLTNSFLSTIIQIGEKYSCY